ncbi:outer membrane beta-barrel family protein [Massilia sp. 9096]|uniref:outer membrane beta-barrel family protein n=1 Tax=Massilia sp. 9096 TaxID=1500894 RepID=UPI00055FEEFC|nr:outer membrane beta-barrel family protein [Massilia sp. 9096]
MRLQGRHVTSSTIPTATPEARAKAGDRLALKLLPALLLGCFVTQPLLAQTTAPASGAAAQAGATTAARAPAGSGATSKGADDVATVEVVATRPTNKVDRDVYETKNDISVSNASASDILNNVPSVSVDQDGNVQLRGNSNVQIMVNGKRDAQFQGQNRGDALNSFPAEAIESIEVINVPGAEFGNEGGSGPIINLVLKRNRKPGSRANMSVNKGTEGRYTGFLNGEHAEGPYSISGNIGVRNSVRDSYNEQQRQDLDPATGAPTSAQDSSGNSHTKQQGLNAASTFTYNLGERDQVGASVSYSKSHNDVDSVRSTQRFGGAMDPIADYTSYSHSTRPADSFGVGASYDHKSGVPGEDLKFDLRYTGQDSSSDQTVLYDYRLQPTPYTANSVRSTDSRNRILDISLDYERNLWSSWHMKAGAKYADSRNDNPTNYLAEDPLTGEYLPLPSRISNFDSDDKNAAIYGILSAKLFDNLSIQGGLRGEYTELNVHQPLLNETDKYYYTNWLPSFYATRDLKDGGMLQLRASRRVQRPNERDLNPNLVYLSDFSARQGNPQLQPVSNDLVELAYRDRFFGVDSSFTLFKRRESPVVSNLNYALATDPNVIVTSPLNYGANDQVGVDLNFNVRKLFIPGLSANLGATILNEKRLRLSSLANDMSGQEQKNHKENAKLRLAYQLGMDSFQLNVNHTGAGLTGQGTTGATTMTNFTWLHRVTPRLSLNLNVSNVFHTGNSETFVDNEVLNLHNLTVSQPRLVSIGLRYTWGGVTGDDRLRNGAGRGMFRGGPGGPGGPGGDGAGGFGPGGGGWGGGGGGGGGPGM